ncbi:helix-turn-helix domain-containing protein [Patulibacter medicamentivorans]|uniref:helix-turn-helix domain-containing protein n=1 Tax=Patulibacter medicamentivorans TaxID=1097667 RepID=UPI0006835B40|nr:helix-turn-helix domain-containing protein [Patulibacter medicamentivorans]
MSNISSGGVSLGSARLCTLHEAAAYLGVTERWMRRAVVERRLPFVKVGRLVRFDVVDLDAYIASQRVESDNTQ